ncbi:MAG: MoxR family ATPase, partial [Thermosphaera sp.]|nr:MoxR family ATPase [Thermosphaera sp.]
NSNPKQNPIEIARQRLLEVEKTLNAMIIGHEDFIKALMIASVAGEHIVVIGPPGTAKSYAVRLFTKLVNASFYQYLLTKFTSFDEIFGTVDIVSLSKGEFRRNWSKIISSEFVFLDEIFKANSAILNALLSLLQERVVYDPLTGAPIEAKLHTAVGASNETPEDPELQALYDRFAIRVFISYLEDDKLLLNAIQARWLNSNSVQPIASMNDIKTLHQYAMTLMSAKIKDLGDVYRLYHVNVVPLVKSLRTKGVIVSDRTVIEKLPKLYCSYLALYGVTLDNVMNATYEIVQYLARNREELQSIRKAIDEALGEVAELARKLEKAKEYLKARNLANAKEVLKDILNYDISRLERTPWLKPRVEAIIQSARQYLEYIQQVEEMLEKMSKSM